MPSRRRADHRFGGTPRGTSRTTSRSTSSGLAGARTGVPMRLTAVHVEPADRLRLAELGLRPGAVVTVLRRMAGGARLVALGTSRIALDPRTAAALAVEEPA